MKRLYRFLSSFIALAMIFSCLPLDSIADEITDALKCRSVSEASYSVQENVITEWPGHANIEIVFTNTGDEPIFNWNYSFEFIYNIESPYNCTVLEHEGDLYTVGNSGWNKDIGPGESVTIGFTASSNDGSDIEAMPSFYLLNNEQITLAEGAVNVEYQEYSDWTTGSSGVLILTNNTENAIGSWTLSFFTNRPITDAYGFTLSSNDDGTYTITGDGYTEIPAGGTVQIGIQCGEHDSSVPFEIANVSVYSSTLALSLNEDSNANGVPDVAEIDSTGFIEITTPTPTAEPTNTETPTDTPTDTPEPTPTEFVFTPDKDLDGDGLYTSEEEMYGTDPNNPDSDGDGVSDGNEIQMMYFPTESDSDLNGVLDGDEDYDGDGIINRDEESYGTCLYAADSDYDGINDYEEIFAYNTDPYEEDSDGDYILDGDEFGLGLDPTADTTEGVMDNENTADYSFDTTAEQISEFNTDDQPFAFSFDITAAGCVDKYIKVEETGYKYAIEDNSTILGKSPEIVYDYAMKVDSVTVRYTLKNGYEADIDKYCVFYYWEGYNILIPIETEYDYDTGTVYATNSMIGTYCLVDTEQMYDLLDINEEVTDGKNNSKKYLKSEAEETDQESNPTYTVSDAKVYNGHEYFLITSDTPMLYDEAVAVCDMYDGYPAVITSAEENAFIESISNRAWIGGRVRFHGISNPTVEWITGEECTFTYWAFGAYNANDFPQWEGFPLTTAGIWGWNWRDPETYTEKSVICERPVGTELDDYTIPGIESTIISPLTFDEFDLELNCYSDSDMDSDGLKDYEELSVLDLGSFDKNTGNYNAATFGEYADIAMEHGIPVSAGALIVLKDCIISSYKSNPYSSDKDCDGYADFEDANPEKPNENIIILLEWSANDLCNNESRMLCNNYRSLGLKCEIWEFNGYASFIEKWGWIGSIEPAYTYIPIPKNACEDQFYGTYYYNVTDVVLISHGTTWTVDEDDPSTSIPGAYMELGLDECLFPEFRSDIKATLKQYYSNFHFITDIAISRKFDSLSLLVCSAATQKRADVIDMNLAETFISHFSSINKVYAFDCDCFINYSYYEERITWVGKIINKVLMRPELLGEYSVIMNAKQDELGGILELYYPEVFSGYNGQVLYYRLINGEYDVNLDLYPGTTDIEYIQIYGLTEEELENDTYKEANTKIRSATEVEFYGYFDPVLE